VTKYSRGANFERRVIKELSQEGWFCFRSAGSHKPADVIAFKGGEVMLVQCQITPYFSISKRFQLAQLAGDNGFQAKLAWREKGQIKMCSVIDYEALRKAQIIIKEGE